MGAEEWQLCVGSCNYDHTFPVTENIGVKENVQREGSGWVTLRLPVPLTRASQQLLSSS